MAQYDMFGAPPLVAGTKPTRRRMPKQVVESTSVFSDGDFVGVVVTDHNGTERVELSWRGARVWLSRPFVLVADIMPWIRDARRRIGQHGQHAASTYGEDPGPGWAVAAPSLDGSIATTCYCPCKIHATERYHVYSVDAAGEDANGAALWCVRSVEDAVMVEYGFGSRKAGQRFVASRVRQYDPCNIIARMEES